MVTKINIRNYSAGRNIQDEFKATDGSVEERRW